MTKIYYCFGTYILMCCFSVQQRRCIYDKIVWTNVSPRRRIAARIHLPIERLPRRADIMQIRVAYGTRRASVKLKVIHRRGRRRSSCRLLTGVVHGQTSHRIVWWSFGYALTPRGRTSVPPFPLRYRSVTSELGEAVTRVFRTSGAKF